MPTWRMPSPNRKRGPSGSRFASIEARRLSTDFSFQPSRPSSSSRCLLQAEDVGGRVKPAQLDEFGDRLLAQPLDVERAARHEMPQPLEPLGRADQAAGAADVDLAFLGDRLALAFRAMVGEDVRVARFVARQILDHLRDDVAGALDAHAVADAQAEPRDLVAIVERDVGDDHAADADRSQPPDRRQLAGAPDLDVDRFQRRLGLLRREFVREAPARRAPDEAEPLLPVEPADLVDDAVDVVGQVRARRLDRAIMVERFVDSLAALQQVADRECRSDSIRFIARS